MKEAHRPSFLKKEIKTSSTFGQGLPQFSLQRVNSMIIQGIILGDKELKDYYNGYREDSSFQELDTQAHYFIIGANIRGRKKLQNYIVDNLLLA